MSIDLKRRTTQQTMRSLIVLMLLGTGCGQQSVTGGTGGTLSTDGNPLPDVKLTIFAVSSEEPLGFAISGNDGSFELVRPGAAGPLQLEPGSYVATLESVGAPTVLPGEYLDRQKTPLKFDWNEGDELKLNVPDLKLR